MSEFQLKPCPFCGRKMERYEERTINIRGNQTRRIYWMHKPLPEGAPLSQECVLDEIDMPFTIAAGDERPQDNYPGEYPTKWNQRARADSWIPCSERLPELMQYVLCLMVNGTCKVMRRESDKYWQTDFKHPFRGDHVTHWMHLPEPPEGDGDA